ncbi:MAG: hypothetical protein GQ574_25755 [Crocinitomix sp.]|nr:hypothetical protein [Crocinitomix sp.]
MKNKLLIGLVLALIVSSCTIEKRHYLPGYHVQSKYKVKGTQQESSELEVALHNLDKNQVIEKLEIKDRESIIKDLLSNIISEQDDVELIAYPDNPEGESENVEHSPINLNTFTSPSENLITKKEPAPADSCDVIMLTDGTEIFAKVLGIGGEEIKYKRCDNLSGPIIVIKKSSVFIIKYPNGTKDVITTIDDVESDNAKTEELKANPTLLSIGWSFLISGIVTLLLLSILIGLILGLVGFIILIAAMASRK